MKARTVCLAVATVLAVATGCSGTPASRTRSPVAESAPTTSTVDAAAIKANELGVVPVLMYHRLSPVPKDDYDRAPEDFRAELQRLYDSGYRPVLARDLVADTMDVPAGRSPVVLTFDDSTVSQYAMAPDGSVAADTAVGMLLDFATSHPDFRPVATMYVNGNPFKTGTRAGALQDLARRGFELGAHTLTHQNLGNADGVTVQRELVEGMRVIERAVPGEKVVTMALPFGVHPKDRALEHAGTWDGETYSYAGVFLVGAAPSPSPSALAFDPLSIPRIRSQAWDGGTPNFGSDFWLDTLDRHPERRYVSDGDPSRISFPAGQQALLAPAAAARANPY